MSRARDLEAVLARFPKTRPALQVEAQKAYQGTGTTVQHAGWDPFWGRGGNLLWMVPYWQLGGELTNADETKVTFLNDQSVTTLTWLIRNSGIALLVGIPIIFQPELRRMLEKKFGRRVEVSVTTDPALLGGFMCLLLLISARWKALAVVGDLDIPLARPLQPAPGEIQSFTPSSEALYVPNIDEALDDEQAKREFWAAFRVLGQWWAQQPPY